MSATTHGESLFVQSRVRRRTRLALSHHACLHGTTLFPFLAVCVFWLAGLRFGWKEATVTRDPLVPTFRYMCPNPKD